MNAPLIWIIFPGVTAGIFYIFRNFRRLVTILTIGVCLFLALLAWQLPIGSPISLGPWQALPKIVISESLPFLGRQFLINTAARPALIVLYLGSALWFVGAVTIRSSRLFAPLGLAIAALLTAAISVQPFLYAALIIEVAVIVSVPILSPPGSPLSPGVLRYLTFQTIGMLLLVFSGWMVGIVELNANEPTLVLRASILLGLGFMMTMSVFPFSTWIPMLARQSNPYAAAFVFFTLPEVISLFAFNIFGRYNWLQNAQLLTQFFSALGLIMIIGGGFWAIFQNNLGRIFGYAVITEIGLSLLTIGQILTKNQTLPAGETSLITQIPLTELFFALLLPRGLNLAIWALSLSIIKQATKSLDFQALRGKAYHFPIATVSICLAAFSIAGFPLLAGYPVRSVLGINISSVSTTSAALTLVGYFGLIIATIRGLVSLFQPNEHNLWRRTETRPQTVLLLIGCFILLLIGIFPQFFLSGSTVLFP